MTSYVFCILWYAAAPSLVVNVTSAGMYLAKCDVHDLQVPSRPETRNFKPESRKPKAESLDSKPQPQPQERKPWSESYDPKGDAHDLEAAWDPCRTLAPLGCPSAARLSETSKPRVRGVAFQAQASALHILTTHNINLSPPPPHTPSPSPPLSLLSLPLSLPLCACMRPTVLEPQVL